MVDTTEQVNIRAEHIERAVKGFALPSYKFKQLLMVMPTGAWKNTYWQETAADISPRTPDPIRGVPRLAQFPRHQHSWLEVNSVMEKYAAEDFISWEDTATSEFDVQARTLLRIARSVTKQVDTKIWNVITEDQSASNINSLSITAGNEWNSDTIANRDPIQNILDAKSLIEIQDHDTTNGMFLVLSPKDYANLLGNPNIRNAGQFWSDGVTRNGRVGKLAGCTVIVSNNVTADFAAVVKAKVCGTWKTIKGLTVRTINDPGIKVTIRAWEYGTAQLVNPLAVTLIDNTQK